MLFDDLILSPFSATILIVTAVLAGTRYRRVWKEEGPRGQLWFFGLIAAISLLLLAFVPLEVG